MRRKCLSVILSFCILMGSAAADVGDVSVSGAQMKQGETVAETEKVENSGDDLDEVETLETEVTEVQETVEKESEETEELERQQTEEIEPEKRVELETSDKEGEDNEELPKEETIKGSRESLQSGDFTYEVIYYNDGTVGIEITDYNGLEEEVAIPSEIDGKVVTIIGSGVFGYCRNISSIVLPQSITRIESYAFEDCSSLSYIEIPESVTMIGFAAFRGCSSLSSIEIPENVTSIENNVFEDCSSLSTIAVCEGNNVYDSRDNCNAIIETTTNTLQMGCKNTVVPKSVTKIGENAFSNCNSLNSIEIPGNVISIEEEAFAYCENLRNIVLPESVTNIGRWAFVGCSSLESVIILGNVTSIGESTFEECTNLESIIIPESVTGIGEEAFYGCRDLNSIVLPESVTRIEKGAFRGCTSLSSVVIPEKVTYIGQFAFASCSSLSSIELLGSMAYINDYTFWHCISLNNIKIPEGVTTIGQHAFDSCSNLKSIELPKSVTDIRYGAFDQCKNVTFYCIENSYAHTYAMRWDIPYEFLTSTPPAVSATQDACTIVVIDSEYNTPIPDASISLIGASGTTDENGIFQANIEEPSEMFITTTADGYVVDMSAYEVENGKTVYIYLTSETGEFCVTYAKGIIGGSDGKNLLTQKMYLGTNENNLPSTSDNTKNLTITLQGRGDVAKYELLADGKVVAENTTGSFAYPLILKSGDTVFETPLFTPDAPFKAGQSISARLTNSDGEQATANLGIRICKNGYKLEEVEKSGKIAFGDSLKITMPDTVPFIGGRETSFGFEEALPFDFEAGADGKVKISINKPTNQNIERFKEDYDKLSSRAQSLNEAAEVFGGTPQAFGGGYFSVKGNVIGYGEGYLGELEDGKIRINVGVILSVKASAGYTQYFFAGAIPFYVSVDGGVSVSSELKMGIEYEDDMLEVNGGFGDMSGKIFLKADAGVGVKEMVSVEIEGNAALNILWKPSNNYQKLYMTDSLAIHSALFGWKADLWDSGTQEWLLYENSPQAKSSESNIKAAELADNMYDLSVYQMEDRSYLEETTELKGSQKAGTGSSQIIRQAVYPQAEPKLIKAGEKSYLFWLEDIPERTAENRSALVYAVSSDGTNWSEPVQLVEESRNATADFEYDLATDGDKIYIVYTEGAETFASGVDLQTISENLSVAYAVLDTTKNQTETVTALTDKAGCYMLPQVIVYQGTPYCAWVTNDLAGKEGIFGNGNNHTITMRNMETNQICYEKTQKSGHAVVSMDMGYIGNLQKKKMPILAYQLDTDGDLTTAEDREIVYTSGTSVANDVNLTSNSSVDANPVFAELGDTGYLFWYQAGKLLATDNLTDSYQILDANTSNFNCAFTAISGNSGESKIIWEASPLEKEGTCIYAIDYQGGQNWSAPYILAETDSAYTSHPNGYSEGEKTLLTYLRSEKQADGSSVKSICVTSEAPYTDISLDYAVYDETVVSLSENLPLTLTVSNQGSQKVDNMSVTCNGTVIANITNADLGVSETKQYTVDGFTVPEEILNGVTSYILGVTTEGDRRVDNNETEIKLGYTDLYLKTDVALQNGQECVNVSVLNRSEIPSGAVLRLYADKEDGEVLWEKKLDSISKDKGTGLVIPLSKFTQKHCTFYVAVEAEKEEGILGNNKELVYTGFGTGMEGGVLVPDALTYTVTFDSAGGSSVEPEQVEEYMKATEPASPQREGYHFTGWYLGDVLYDFDTEVTENITLTAGWKEYEQAAMPNAGIASGSQVAKNTKVNLTCPTEGAEIYYTTDGSQPTVSSAKYAEAITIDRNMIIKAIAVKQGYRQSNVAEFTYTVYENQNSADNGDSSGGSASNPHPEDGDNSGGASSTPQPGDGDNTSGASPTPQPGDTGNADGSVSSEVSDETDSANIKVKKIVITTISKKIAAGKKVSLKAVVTPENASNSKIKWETSNKKYATVNSKGVVTTKKAGRGKTVTITAKAADGSGVKAKIKLKLMKNAVKKVKITSTKKSLKAGKTLTLKAKVTTTGKNANTALKWSTSNSKYATVNSKGKVTAKKAGKGKTVTITAMSTDGTNKKSKIKIKIY